MRIKWIARWTRRMAAKLDGVSEQSEQMRINTTLRQAGGNKWEATKAILREAWKAPDKT